MTLCHTHTQITHAHTHTNHTRTHTHTHTHMHAYPHIFVDSNNFMINLSECVCFDWGSKIRQFDCLRYDTMST